MGGDERTISPVMPLRVSRVSASPGPGSPLAAPMPPDPKDIESASKAFVTLDVHCVMHRLLATTSFAAVQSAPVPQTNINTSISRFTAHLVHINTFDLKMYSSPFEEGAPLICFSPLFEAAPAARCPSAGLQA